MKNSKLKFIEYMQNISRSKSFGKFVLIVKLSASSKVKKEKNKVHTKTTQVYTVKNNGRAI